MMETIKSAIQKAIAIGVWLSIGFIGPAFCAQPQMDNDELLKPLVDTRTASPGNGLSQPLQGNAFKQQSGFPSQMPAKQPDVLKIQVKTFQEASILEKNVNWYAWYLSVRGYLNATGGLNDCVVGTPIKIYKLGRIEALSPDPVCRASVAWRNFPLPRNTQLDALVLPVRPGRLPPASPEELQSRVQMQSQNY